MISTILRCVDAIRDIVSNIEIGGGEGDHGYTALLSELEALYKQSSGHAQALDPPAAPPLAAVMPLGRAVSDPGAEPPQQVREPVVAGQTVRVAVELLETLMTSVSELVLTRNQLLQILRNEPDSVFSAPLRHLSLVTTELQESIMKTRMQPISNVWSAFPRLIRDLAHDLDKKIELVMDGAETELDRQVLELIKDPLIYIIRNAADHGLETAVDRLMASKNETGRIRLNAFHEGGHIIVQVSDDGRGLDIDRIRRKAAQNGLATEAELAMMPDAQIFRFVMRPGFSTAASVTAVSGRGVGMDVVRVNIEKIGGTLDLTSTQGRGACFTMKIPLTLAIVSALVVGCAGHRFALPQISVVELVHSSETGESRIQHIGNTALLRLRERLLPLIRLDNLLGLGAGSSGWTNQVVIIIQTGAVRFGLVVDQVFDTEEIVVKPVSPVLKGIGVYSGNAILGDGSVCMIIDPNGVVEHLGDHHTDTSQYEGPANSPATEASGRRFLLIRAGAGTRKAIALDQIARLEEIDVQQIFYSHAKMIVLYRDRLMSLNLASPDIKLRDSGMLPVLVLADQPPADPSGTHLDRRPRQVGLVVDQILDITETDAEIEITWGRSDIIGSALIDGEPTDVINVAFHLEQASDATRIPIPKDLWRPGRTDLPHHNEITVHEPN